MDGGDVVIESARGGEGRDLPLLGGAQLQTILQTRSR